MSKITGLMQSLLAAFVTVLLLASSNLDQGLVLSDLNLPILIACIVAVIAWLVAGMVVGNSVRRGIAGVALTFGWLLYGYYADPVEQSLPVADIHAKLVTLGLFVLSWLAAARWFGRTERDLTEFSRGLSAALAAMAVFAFILVLRGFGSAARPVEESQAFTGSVASDGIVVRDLPDIFLIVLDAYSRSDHLLDIYSFNNSQFERRLEEMGFQIPSRARANYTATFLSLTAMLNRNYLEVLRPNLHPGSASRNDVYALLEDNLTARELKALGYEYVFFRSRYPPLSRSRLADRQIPDKLAGEFQEYFTAHTILMPLALGYCAATRCLDDAWPVTPAGAVAIKAQFGAVAELASEPGPKFVFVHFMLPHEPFRLDADCAPLEPVWPTSFVEEEANSEIRRLYREQVQCTNRLVLDMVGLILEERESDPIILIQSDHGYGRLPWGRPTEYQVTDTVRVRERLSLFAAYRFPADNAPVVPHSISPVNVFRLVFASYFGRDDLTPLEDRSFWSDEKRPYDFTLVSPAE